MALVGDEPGSSRRAAKQNGSTEGMSAAGYGDGDCLGDCDGGSP